ncbi:MAG: folate family ECF transporter S component [Clostridia bacterium]|nr:folate family ECF transporter S component [Clostridia bacterium]
MSKNISALKKEYWCEAAKNFSNIKMITIAAVITALRIAVKMLRVPMVAGLELTLDCYINSLGAFIYGPLVGLLVGAVSDTLGAILFPSGAYFFPFIFVEMASSFIFGIFLWNRDLKVSRVILSKFTVNLVCNMILTSVFMKWYYIFFGIESAYPLVNLLRIVKNLVLFSLEGILITVILRAAIPALKSVGIINGDIKTESFTKKHILLIALLLALSVAILLLYIFFLKDYLTAHNIKFL